MEDLYSQIRRRNRSRPAKRRERSPRRCSRFRTVGIRPAVHRRYRGVRSAVSEETVDISSGLTSSAQDASNEDVTDAEPSSKIHNFTPAESSVSPNDETGVEEDVSPPADGGAFFSGDTNFFSLHWALQTIAKERLTGRMRCFWDKAPVELLAYRGRIVLATTHDAELYCSEAPITLVNVDAEKIAQARSQQAETGAPLFITLAQEDLILHEPAQQLVQHYGQKLFAQLWTAKRVRFVFEQSEDLPDYANDIPPEEDVDQWSLDYAASHSISGTRIFGFLRS